MENSKSERDQFKAKFGERIKLFVLSLVRFVDSLLADGTSKIIANQLMRSGASVGANYFEARAASSKADFINFFNHSLKSANESKFWIEILIGSEKCDATKADGLLKEVTEISNILASSILTLKNKK